MLFCSGCRVLASGGWVVVTTVGTFACLAHARLTATANSLTLQSALAAQTLCQLATESQHWAHSYRPIFGSHQSKPSPLPLKIPLPSLPATILPPSFFPQPTQFFSSSPTTTVREKKIHKRSPRSYLFNSSSLPFLSIYLPLSRYHNGARTRKRQGYRPCARYHRPRQQ